MGKWFAQAQEIQRLRDDNARQAALLSELSGRLRAAGIDVDLDVYGVSDEERDLAEAGKPILAIKLYRERIGATLAAAKEAIDSVTRQY